MPSFFEKLKKGMGIEGPAEAGTEEEIEEKPKPVRIKKPKKESKPPIIQIKKLEIRTEPIKKEGKEDRPSSPFAVAREVEEVEEPKPEEEKTPLVKAAEGEEDKSSSSPFAVAREDKEKWFEAEGELAIDVYQTENELVIQSAIAGVKPENLDILIEQDIITIKGSREKPEDGGAYFSQECYWGPFSRKVILPVEIDPNRIEATMKEGILTIRLPKILRERKRKIVVRS